MRNFCSTAKKGTVEYSPPPQWLPRSALVQGEEVSKNNEEAILSSTFTIVISR